VQLNMFPNLVCVLVSINVLTWNVRDIISSSTYLSDGHHKHKLDICGISEHWLQNYCLDYLKSIDNMYIWYAVSEKDLMLTSNQSVCVALSYHAKYTQCITHLDIDDDRLIGIQFQISKSIFIFFFQVYLPCSNHSITKLREYIDKMYDLCV
jgi:hypothetical protein